MIEVRVHFARVVVKDGAGKASRQLRVVALEVEGHSGLATKGADLLCAAVSVLTENLSNSLRFLLELEPDSELADGLFRLRLPESVTSDSSELLFNSTILGLRVLAEQFSEYMNLSYYGVEGVKHGT